MQSKGFATMQNDDLMTLHKIVDTLADKSNGNENLLIEAHRIINRLTQTGHFCGPWQPSSDPYSSVEECVICGAHRSI